MSHFIKKTLGQLLNGWARIHPASNAKLSFKLLSKVPKKRISQQAHAFYRQVSSKAIPLSKKEAVLHSWGHGDKHILMLHGWQSNASHWRKYLNYFDESAYTLHMLDAPAHGHGTGQSLHLELYREAVEKAVDLIGNVHTLAVHSLGNLAAIYALSYNSELTVKQMVVMGSPSGMDAILAYFKQELHLSALVITQLEAQINHIIKMPLDVLQLDHFLAKAQIPILVIHDHNDKITPIGPIRDAVATAPLVKTYFTTHQDHRLQEEDTIFAVREFIQEKSYVF
ncbi:MAG: alpha/beta hydrolase [Dokdonia sp.]|jgi:pimeloyl-ACP methyl ester carboxylesterase